MHTQVILGLIATTLLTVQSANACLYFDDLAGEPVRPLVDRASSIVLADVVSLKIIGERREYGIHVVEVLKGPRPSTSKLTLDLWESTFRKWVLEKFNAPSTEDANHQRLEFWVGRTSAGLIDDNCGVQFAPSKGRHLIFDLGKSRNLLGFEPVRSSADPWYQIVKAAISNPALLGREMDPMSFVRWFPQVGLMECALPISKLKTALHGSPISGQFVPIFGDDTSKDFYCSSAGREYVALFTSPGDNKPYSVPVQDGVLKFDRSYANIALSRLEMPLSELLPPKRKRR